ncbi:unnamed protein product [Lampetra planeri]
MSTHRRVCVWASDDKDEEELIPPTATEERVEALPAEQSAVGARDTSPSLEALVRDVHSLLLTSFKRHPRFSSRCGP